MRCEWCEQPCYRTGYVKGKEVVIHLECEPQNRDKDKSEFTRGKAQRKFGWQR